MANISAVGQGPLLLLDLGWLLRYLRTLRMEEMLAELACLVNRLVVFAVENTVSSLSAVAGSIS